MKSYYLSKEQINNIGCTLVLWQGIKHVILENLSTIIKIESLPCFDLGKPKIKYMETSTQGSLVIEEWVYNPLRYDHWFELPTHDISIAHSFYITFRPKEMFIQHF